MRVHRVLLVAACLASVLAACTRVEVVGAPGGVPIGEAGSGGEEQGGSGSAAGEASAGEAGTSAEEGGAPGFDALGVWPTYAASPSQRDAASVTAAVSALAIGSRTLPVHERWDELSGATGSPRVLAWQRLDAMVEPYRERGADLALCIDIVDRTLRAWPFAGELDTPAAASAIRSTIDEVFERYAGQLSHLCFGYEVDRYIAQASGAARNRLLTLLKVAVAHAQQHPQRAARTAIGVAVTLQALVTPDTARVDELRLGDEVVAVYDPLDETGQVKPPGAIAEELSHALANLAERDSAPRKLSLFEAGYPSSAAVGSSEQAQEDHISTLLAAVEAERATIGFVGLYGLNDRAATDCEAEAKAFGVPAGTESGSARALARCSMGLRAESSEPKAAWPAVLSALSRD